MHTLHLGRHLGDLTSPTFKRYYLHQQLESLDHNLNILFDARPKQTSDDGTTNNEVPIRAHKAGTNCIAIDQYHGRYLATGGADTAIRLWDLEASNPSITNHPNNKPNSSTTTHHPQTSISKTTPTAHTHSITSLSIFPPSTPSSSTPPTHILSTSYDTSLLLTQLTPTSLQPLHKFPLDHTVYTHAVSPLSNSSAAPLVAVGTSHPAPRLIDLRSGLATHSLPGHSGAIWSVAWHPRKEHVLVSSGTDGRILVFDTRRAVPAFASFDFDDSLGVTQPPSLLSPVRPTLDYKARAHEAPITGVLFNHSGDKLISVAHDQRIRVWDVVSGRNDLVHFGPRIRNIREGELKPVLAPFGANIQPNRELLLWPNDDGRGEIFVCEIREGATERLMKTKEVVQTVALAKTKGKGGKRGGGGGGGMKTVDKFTSGGRINALAFRPVFTEGAGGSELEMYSAYGDGRVCAWTVGGGKEDDELDEVGEDEDKGGKGEDSDEQGRPPKRKKTTEEVDEERRRKRKKDLIEGLVEGLTKKPVIFS